MEAWSGEGTGAKAAARGGAGPSAAEQSCRSRTDTDGQPQTCKSSTYLSKAATQETRE